jgi:hypothetical protein
LTLVYIFLDFDPVRPMVTTAKPLSQIGYLILPQMD